jgi:glycosyltransferase involved in cell wall biosynthesis
MKVLALEPYYGGSHRAFLDDWSAHSRHAWTILGLPPFKWKWRMRHSAYTLAEQVRERIEAGEHWDLLFCSDMLDLAAFRGLAPAGLRQIPSIAYFHENQLTYPVRHESERDYHFGYTNMTTALAATRVWFNSAFNRDSFLDALPAFLKRMPDYQPLDAVERIRGKSSIQPQGVRALPSRGERQPGPLRILWAARWEHDKNPRLFFEALGQLRSRGVDFRLSVIGENFRDVPDVFALAKKRFGDRIDRWGYQPTRADYEAALQAADVIVSTADHEFFGVSVVEALVAGAWPVLPRRLAYPELLSAVDPGEAESFFYDGTAGGLADRLRRLACRLEAGDLWQGDPRRAARAVARFTWPHLAPRLDDAVESLTADQAR